MHIKNKLSIDMIPIEHTITVHDIKKLRKRTEFCVLCFFFNIVTHPLLCMGKFKLLLQIQHFRINA